jgi:hypothetical protein
MVSAPNAIANSNWSKNMFKRIASELGRHVPFTAAGAATGILIMLLIIITKVPSNVSEIIYYTLHPAHIVFSAIVTTAMYMRYGKRKLWVAILIGYTGSVGIATLSDAIIPYLEGMSFGLTMHLHLGFIEKWWLINPLAFLGIAIGYWRQITKLPHALHVLLSTWASLFYFTAFAAADWFHLLPFVFLFLFLAVWIPCCVSDIVYPLLFLKADGHEHSHS